MFTGVVPTNDRRRGVPRAGGDELIGGADAAIGVRFPVHKDPTVILRTGTRARLSDVERDEVQSQLTHVRIRLRYTGDQIFMMPKVQCLFCFENLHHRNTWPPAEQIVLYYNKYKVSFG